jgi:tetratricopeptide (TPR) repeat protein
MPPAARSAVTSQAQGIPLFAVETVRALIDRDIVRPVEGVYQLTGDVGQLAVPDSLHALLAARLDALDPAVRRLVTDAAVLGAGFPAEALIAVSGRDEPAVRAALADLVRREVLTVSADPLSPERGSYRFAQQMLRQVAYDTLSRRDRKTRHLAVAAHLRAAFAGDGDLDALNAVPDDPDTAQIRDQAIGTLVRAAERAARTGAAGRAAASYASAAELSQLADEAGQADTGPLWENAAQAAIVAADYAGAIQYAGRARDCHLRRGQVRTAARAQATVGRALRLWGRLAEAHEQLTEAARVLRADPDTDTVRALDELAALGVHAGSPDADRLSSEALILGQALGVGRDQLSTSFVTRGIYLISVDRRPESVAYLHEAARLATQTGDNAQLGRALVNLSDALAVTDPQAAAEAARTAAGHLRRVGARAPLTFAITNLVQALLMVGDWDTADRELSHAVDSDGLAVIEHIVCYRGWLAALRGDVATAEAMLAGLRDLRENEDAQTKAEISLAEAFIAAVHRQPEEALRHARDVLVLLGALGVSHECVRWAWPLAARAAHELSDAATTGELLALLDSYQPGYLAPVLQAERGLTRARLAHRDDGQSAGAAFASAIASLRQQSTPYHLAHGLLDHAEHLLGRGDAEGAAAAIEEARGIGTGLHCEPLLTRADAIEHARPRIPA